MRRGIASPLTSMSYEAVNSALGITRISHISVSQVLHATPADIAILRSHLNSWQAPNYKPKSYPLLLRSLTHPSISSWAEKMLDLPKTSLGPQTMELLGDSVIGTATASYIYNHHLHHNSSSRGAGALLKSLICNKGMAATARRIGIENLLRWEKPTPPSTHRYRVDDVGIDKMTGLQSMIQVNALANAYESVAAAIYLDGGFNSTFDFVNSTLLKQPSTIQNINKESTDYEFELEREILSLFNQPIHFIRPKRSNHHDNIHNNNRNNTSSIEKIEVELLDLMQRSSIHTNNAHPLFFSAVVIKKRDGNRIEVGQHVRRNRNLHEDDIISLTSHFSVESARIAALKQAIALLRGELKPPHSLSSTVPTLREDVIIHREISTAMTNNNEVDAAVAGLVEMQQQLNIGGLTTKFDETGRWQYDSDYEHVGHVLKKVGLRTFSNITTHCDSASHIQNRLKIIRQQHQSQEEENSSCLSSTNTQEQNISTSSLLPTSKLYSNINPGIIEEHIRKGKDLLESESELHQTHSELLAGISENGEDIVNKMDEETLKFSTLNRKQRLRRVVGLHSLGHQAIRLWAAQCSIRDVSQDRQEVIPLFESRVGACGAWDGEIMMGDDYGLSNVVDGGVKKCYVAVGLCVQAVGMETACAWLSGAEGRIRGRF